jgi:hypothetical protein
MAMSLAIIGSGVVGFIVWLDVIGFFKDRTLEQSALNCEHSWHTLSLHGTRKRAPSRALCADR